jgi:hypothetical protein
MAFKKGCLDASDFSLAGPNQSAVNSALSRADSNFWSDYSDAVKALEGGELIGELRQTAKGVIDIGQRMLIPLLDWKRSLRRQKNRWKSPRRLAEDISGAYLAWKFGWDPLVKDTRALLSDLKEDYFDVVRLESVGKGVGASSSWEAIHSLGICTWKSTYVQKHTASVTYLGEVKMRRYGVGGLMERLGLSPRNFVPTIYNLLPWTYMIDYFTNLGDIVSAIGCDPAAIAWCCRTTRQELTTVVTSGVDLELSSGLKMHPGYPIVDPQITTWKSKTVNRVSTIPTRIPSFHLKLPSFQSEAGRTRWTNIAAVLAAKTWGSSTFTPYG